MTEQIKQAILRLLEDPDARAHFMRGVKEITAPSAEYQNFEVSKTLYVMLAIGPVDAHVENSIRAALGHDPMSFVR
jgi:carbon monoxide dehydrogenase subunit G